MGFPDGAIEEAEIALMETADESELPLAVEPEDRIGEHGDDRQRHDERYEERNEHREREGSAPRGVEADELAGLDATEMGVLAYPDFAGSGALAPGGPTEAPVSASEATTVVTPATAGGEI